MSKISEVVKLLQKLFPNEWSLDVGSTATNSYVASLPSSVELKEYQEDWLDCDVRIPWFFDELRLYGTTGLVRNQVGYRWPSSPERPKLPTWSDNWIVLADAGADPVIYDASSGSVGFALHGAGIWERHEFAHSISQFLEVCIVVSNEIRTLDELWTEDGDLSATVEFTLQQQTRGIVSDHQLSQLLNWAF